MLNIIIIFFVLQRVAFHPNCNYVATGSCDRTVRLWDLNTGSSVRFFTGHKVCEKLGTVIYLYGRNPIVYDLAVKASAAILLNGSVLLTCFLYSRNCLEAITYGFRLFVGSHLFTGILPWRALSCFFRLISLMFQFLVDQLVVLWDTLRRIPVFCDLIGSLFTQVLTSASSFGTWQRGHYWQSWKDTPIQCTQCVLVATGICWLQVSMTIVFHVLRSSP